MKAHCIQLAFVAIVCAKAFAVNFPYSEWNLANYEGAYATFSDGLVSVADGGSDYWNVQLTRRNVELQAGKTYELKFFLQGVGARRYTEIRIGRDGFPYDAFADFGEVVASVNGREITKTFKMNSGNVSNARLEFNFGKSSGLVYFSNVSLNCLDCGAVPVVSVDPSGKFSSATALNYVVVAEEVDLRDASMALGNIFGTKLELGVESVVYGDVDASRECFLRDRSRVDGNLRYAVPCTEQKNVVAKSMSLARVEKPIVGLPEVGYGVAPVSVGLDETISLPPGKYGVFYANARAKVRLSSGVYSFQKIFIEPDVEMNFDLCSGPISISVATDVRFGDRNHLDVSGGNPSEISWNIAGSTVDFGTDGKYFGKFIAPAAYVRIPSRSHLVGGVYAAKFLMEPQSTVSQEPRANEISHSEEHFGPFFNPGIFRYKSVLPVTASSVEMFVYVENASYKINGAKNTIVALPSSNGTVKISVARDLISGFPAEAFRSSYVFDFSKSANYRIFWNPQTSCKQGCDGASLATAVDDFEKAVAIAQATGREINLPKGLWDVSQNFSEGVVPWKVGFELVGYTESIWNLGSANNLPIIFLGENTHIQIEGKSPRSFTGFMIGNGSNEENGGAIASNAQSLKLKNILFSGSKSNKNGGAIYSSGDVNIENIHIKNNYAKENGGAIYIDGTLNAKNVVMNNNFVGGNGGAIYSSGEAKAQNVILCQNLSDKDGGAWYAAGGSVKMSNGTVFGNTGKQGHAAIGGNATGEVYNSIFWKNIDATCSVEKCKKELSSSISVHHSITETVYNGTGNIVKDPLFFNESTPAGDKDFMDMTAGLTLQDASPAIGAGIKDDFVLDADILNFERVEKIDVGAYMWYDLNSDYVSGQFIRGYFKPAFKQYPFFSKLGDKYDIFEKGNGRYARVLRKKVPVSRVKDISKLVIEFTLIAADGSPYKINPIRIPFFKSDEKDGFAYFQTIVKDPASLGYSPENHGRMLIYTSDYGKVGEYGDVQVVPLLNQGDILKGKVVEW